MKKLLGIIVMGLLLSGCYATTHELKTRFNPKDASWINDKGNAHIKGQAFLNTKGGTVVTCAGNYVSLTPKNTYSSERMRVLYSSIDMGYLESFTFDYMIITPSAPVEYNSLSRKTRCDAQGNFKFKNVLANKEYFITTSVIWGLDDFAKQGGYLMLKVKPESNETLEVILN